MSGRGPSVFVRMLSGAVLDQALLSAASFVVGLVLIRHTSDLQYGCYILVTNAFLLLTSLQNAFVGPAVVSRVTRLERTQHGGVIGGLYREQRELLTAVIGLGLVAAAAAWALGWLDRVSAPVLLVSLACALAVLYREYFRIVLLAYRRPADVLRGDLPYVLLLVAGAWLATRSAMPTVVAVGSMGLAALCCGLVLSRVLQRHQGWDLSGARGILREIAPLGIWSVSGAAIHWTFSQGYSYLVAGLLDVTAVAAIAATRLLMMPVNLLSTGIRSLMLPLTAGWLHRHGLPVALRRLCLFALGLGCVSVCYFAAMWLLRDWIFASVMQKDFADRDRLLLLWSAIFLFMVVRDQIIMLLIARERFRTLTTLTFASAAVSVAVSWWGMLHHGQIGALVGMLVGEVVNLGGVVLLVLRENRRPLAALEPA